jgi:hypothetical protein
VFGRFGRLVITAPSTLGVARSAYEAVVTVPGSDRRPPHGRSRSAFVGSPPLGREDESDADGEQPEGPGDVRNGYEAAGGAPAVSFVGSDELRGAEDEGRSQGDADQAISGVQQVGLDEGGAGERGQTPVMR